MPERRPPVNSKQLTIAAGAIIGVLILCMGALASCGAASGALAGSCISASFNPPTDDGALLRGYDAEQLANVAVIVHIGQDKSVPTWGWVIAVATARQESSLRNLPNLGATNDHDSIGLFQQRPSQGWGTPEQLADPAYTAGRFFDKLLTVPGWQTMPLTEAAQAVQRSAYPDAYAKWTTDAIALVSTVGAPMGALGLPGCFAGAVGAWTQPVHAPIVSGFRTPDRPGHNGVDLGAARNTIIVAASAGTVTTVTCNATAADGTAWGCDRDGSVKVLGCGWYVDLANADGVITRYCHMQTHPFVNVGDTVVVGQPIGAVGATGNVTGPHLHFEVHLRGDSSAAGAVDPEPFMAAAGAPLGL
jgi:murein DD-endopeptidase MepM/ murein hydrolase activator NlpD